jgi:DNA-binding MarR family transcriptional regulator
VIQEDLAAKDRQIPKELEEVMGEAHHQLLMHQLTRTFWALKLAFEDEVGLSGPLLWIMHLLAKEDGLCQSDLTKVLRVDASATTRMVKVLEHDGLIERKTDPADNRRTLVYLTEAGRVKVADLSERSHNFECKLLSALKPEEMKQIRDSLKLLEDSIKQL